MVITLFDYNNYLAPYLNRKRFVVLIQQRERRRNKINQMKKKYEKSFDVNRFMD